MLAYRQAFASFSVLRNLSLYSSTNGGDASRIGILLSSRLFVGYHAILPMRDASPPFVLEFESEEPGSTAHPRLHISHAHDVGKHTGCCHIGAGAIALNEHGVFVVAFGGEQ